MADRDSITDNPLRRALANAPEDDEPLTPEEEAAIEEAYAEIAAGRTIPDEELWRRLNDEPPVQCEFRRFDGVE